ncbi:hypothetical protein [Domibacillus sp. PGB-M46]|nr:hypothetical protein [Domibacillus sp. PGB-M46]
MGKRSEKLGMPELFQQHELSKWHGKYLQLMAGKYFNKYFPAEMI